MYRKINLKDRRIALGLTQKTVSEFVGVSEATVSRWESGDIADMGSSRIYSLSKILDISPLDIMGWDETKKVLTTESDGDISSDKKHLIDSIHQMSDGRAKVLRDLFDQFEATEQTEK